MARPCRAASRSAALTTLRSWPSWPGGLSSAITYPFLRVGEPAWVTFDRVWIGAIGIWVLYDLIARRDRPRSRAADLVVAAAVLFVVTFGLRAALTPEDRLTVIKVWFDAIVLPVVLLLAARQLIGSMRDLKLLFGALAMTGALLSLIGLAEFAFGFELATRSGGTPFYDRHIDLVRVSGPHASTETYALSLLICLAATLCTLRLRGDGVLSLAAAVAVLELAAIGITFFRAAWLAALVIIVLMFGLPFVRARPRPRVVVALVLGLAVVAFGLIQSDAVSTRLSDSDNVAGRLATWGQDLNVFGTAPVFGVGVERFTSATTDETNVVVSGVHALDNPHNSYLGLLAEQGIVGFIPFALLTVVVWRLIRAVRKVASTQEARYVALCLTGVGVAYLITSLTLTMLPSGPSNALMGLLVGAAAGLLDRVGAKSPATRQTAAQHAGLALP